MRPSRHRRVAHLTVRTPTCCRRSCAPGARIWPPCPSQPGSPRAPISTRRTRSPTAPAGPGRSIPRGWHAFARLLDRYGDPAQAEIAAAVTSSVRAGAGPEAVPTPTDPPGRAARAVAVRKLARSAVSLEVSPAGAVGRPAPVLDPEGDRNAG